MYNSQLSQIPDKTFSYKACKNLLQNTGGRVILFLSSIGRIGSYALSNRDNSAFYNTAKELGLFKPNNSAFQTLAEDCSQLGIAFDIFACAKEYMDIASLSAISGQTGGDIYYYPNFDNLYDEEKLYFNIYSILTREQGLSVQIEIRCSGGISIDQSIGNFIQKQKGRYIVGGVDSDKSFLFVPKYSDKLISNQEVYIQCVMSYNNRQMQRVIRVCNGRLKAVMDVKLLYRHCDVEAIVNTLVRICNNVIRDYRAIEIRQNWENTVLNMLAGYKVALNLGKSQKISLPESLRLLILYTNCSMKLPAFQLGRISPDLRMYSSSVLHSISIPRLRKLIYPSVYKIDDILLQPHQPGLPNQFEIPAYPFSLPCSVSKLSMYNAYLIDNGEILLLSIGQNVPESFLLNILETPSFKQLCEQKPSSLPSLSTQESFRLNNFISDLRANNPSSAQSIIICAGVKNFSVKTLMMEDASGQDMSYQQFMMSMHRALLEKCNNKHNL